MSQDACLGDGADPLTPKQVAELEGRAFARGYAEAIAQAASLLRQFHKDVAVGRPHYELKETQEFIDKFEAFAEISRKAGQ